MNYKGKKVLILGLGLNQGGVGAAKFFAQAEAEVRVTDLKNEWLLKESLDELKDFKNIEYTLGEHNFEDILWADLIIRNPAIKDDNPYLKFAKTHNKKIETDFGIFLDYVKQKNLIAITGTKGKSTTASLIYEAIKASLPVIPSEEGIQKKLDSGSNARNDKTERSRMTIKNVILAGNIGKSILDILNVIPSKVFDPESSDRREGIYGSSIGVEDDTIIIAEISSFQLQALKDSKKLAPHIAVITNIFPDHLNWHKDMDEYIQAKKQIAINQTKNDYLVINKEDEVLTSQDFLKNIQSQIISFDDQTLNNQYAKLPLKGHANLSNYAAALEVCKLLAIPENVTLEAFQNFQGAPFRLQLIGEYNGVKIINDSTATNPQATIEALSSYPNCILIAGGMNKGLDYKNLAEDIEKSTKAVYFLEGDATDEIMKYLKRSSKVLGIGNNLSHVLQIVTNFAKPGDTILFSPGATSFNLFQNEFDRGRKFNEAVKKVFG